MKIEYSYNRESLEISVDTNQEISKILLMTKAAKCARDAESDFIKAFCEPFGIKEFINPPADIFRAAGPMIYDTISMDSYLYPSWLHSDFLSKLVNNETVIWEKI